jgi:nitrite reductase/ring-hydroxylating ferredoxin subunit
MPWRRVFSERALESAGGSVAVKVEDKVIFIARVDGELYAIDAVCTHARCILGSVDKEKRVVRCYCHGAVFDLRSGVMIEPPSVAPSFPKEKMGLKTYGVRINSGWVELDI